MPARGRGALDADTQHLLDVIDPKQYQQHIDRLLARQEDAIEAESKASDAQAEVRRLIAEQQAAAKAAHDALANDRAKWNEELGGKEKNLKRREDAVAKKLKRYDQDLEQYRANLRALDNAEKTVAGREQNASAQERRIATQNADLDKRMAKLQKDADDLAAARKAFEERQKTLQAYIDGFKAL